MRLTTLQKYLSYKRMAIENTWNKRACRWLSDRQFAINTFGITFLYYESTVGSRKDMPDGVIAVAIFFRVIDLAVL